MMNTSPDPGPSFRTILATFLSVCAGTTPPAQSDITSAESTENERKDPTITLCFMVLTFLISLVFVVVALLLFGSPQVLRAIGVWVSQSFPP